MKLTQHTDIQLQVFGMVELADGSGELASASLEPRDPMYWDVIATCCPDGFEDEDADNYTLFEAEDITSPEKLQAVLDACALLFPDSEPEYA